MVRNATADDIAFVVANMREQDRREIEEATGKSAEEAISELDQSPYVALVIWNEEPVAIFGATLRPDGKSAVMFRFATPAWPTVVREAVRFGRRQFLEAMKAVGVEHVYAMTLKDSDTDWLRLFGAKELPEGAKFKNFRVDLVDPPAMAYN